MCGIIIKTTETTMIATLIILILIITFAGAASVVLHQTLQAQDLSNKAIQNSNDLIIIKKALILSAKNDITYGTVLPYGVNGLNYHTIPEFVYLKRMNAFGREYIYCPFSVNQTTLTKEVKLTSTVNYMVDTANIDHNGTNREYVISSHNSPFYSLGVQAIIISPIPPFTNKPSCLQVVYNTELQVFTVEDGKVEVITTNDILIGI